MLDAADAGDIIVITVILDTWAVECFSALTVNPVVLLQLYKARYR